MKQKIKNCLDMVMVVLLPVLMAELLVGKMLHEWLGLLMLVIFVAHHAFNFGWIKNLFKGTYSLSRAFTTCINFLLLVVMVSLAVSGAMMSGYVFVWLNITSGLMFARKLHLVSAFWGLIVMSLHLGVHMGMAFGVLRRKVNGLSESVMKVISIVSKIILLAVCVFGVYSFAEQNVANYLFLKQMFVFYDFTRPTSVFLAEYASMIVLFAAIGYYLNKLFRKAEANRLLKYIAILLPTILSLCMFWIVSSSWQVSSGMTDWQGEVTGESGAVEESSETDQAEEAFYDNYEKEVDDDLIYIQGGTFLMGSPESEDWRSDDETQHEVTVGDFYISAYEVTQKDYQELMEDNPSTFHGENLPVESVSWLDAVRYCNALSEKMGLSCAYEIDGEKVSWNREAEGYRLPTEAEWEYACRAGSTTPFNTENYIGADESNFYGHYPYMIEENYFNQSELSTKPGVYREMTVDVGSFAPNAWGLYDCHGNVGEWVWDYYGEYDTENTLNPTGPENGTMHISRGGGWNDFGKNLRSSYRATSTNGMAAYNVGFRIARGAVAGDTAVSVAIKNESDMTVNHAGKMLIVYYSWSGNTRGVAEEIHRQTGADIFEIELVTPYSTDYNTVLDEAQHDQNIQARPEIVGHIDNMEDYDIVFIGYPNWWASIPMPIASFLDEYDLSGKIIMPFCSHGGGKFGQSLTAISKLEPDAVMMEGLSIHYSGGSELGSNVTEWLCENGIE